MEDKETLNEIMKCIEVVTDTNKQLAQINKQLAESNVKLIDTNNKLLKVNQAKIKEQDEQNEKNLKEIVDLIKKTIYAFVICIGIIVIILCSVIV